MKNDNLRKDCIRLMAERGFAKRGGQTILAKKLRINRNSISMALSGYRRGPGSAEVLNRIREHLRTQENQ
jgi:hypothetical protein